MRGGSSSSAAIALVLLGSGVVAVVGLVVLHLVDDDAAFEASVCSTRSQAKALDNHAQGFLDGATGESSLDFRLSMPSFSSSLLASFDLILRCSQP